MTALPAIVTHHRHHRARMTCRLVRVVLNRCGWLIIGEFPEQRCFIIVAGPHTSNWDFVYGMLAVLALDVRIHWLGKNTLFRAPLKTTMTWLGGIPVDRGNPAGVTDAIAEKLRSAQAMALVITPEGTRSKVEKWKTGFLRIARAADCLLLPATIDFATKTIALESLIAPSEDADADIERIRGIFAEVRPRNLDNF